MGCSHLAVGAAFLHPTPALQHPSDPVQKQFSSQKAAGNKSFFQIQTWLPAQAQECQSQHKREARTMCLGKQEEEEEEGGASPTPLTSV